MFRLHHLLLNGVLGGVGREIKRETRFAVEGNAHRDGVFLEVFLVESGPLCITYSCFVSHQMPKFFGNVRRERREEHDEGLEDGAGVATLLGQFADGNHEGWHTRVV